MWPVLCLWLVHPAEHDPPARQDRFAELGLRVLIQGATDEQYA